MKAAVCAHSIHLNIGYITILVDFYAGRQKLKYIYLGSPLFVALKVILDQTSKSPDGIFHVSGWFLQHSHWEYRQKNKQFYYLDYYTAT